MIVDMLSRFDMHDIVIVREAMMIFMAKSHFESSRCNYPDNANSQQASDL